MIINNSIPADLDSLKGINTNDKVEWGNGSKILFDKKVFLSLLVELERMRKIKTVKKRFYLFHEEYQGMGKSYKEWREAVKKE